MNIGNIFGDIAKWIGVLQGAANQGAPVATDLVTNVGKNVQTLIGIGKDLFAGKQPTPEQLAAAEKARHDLDDAIAKS